jgi:uncharacterized protein (TIGR00369 family)
MTDTEARIESLNANAPDFIRLMGGKITALDVEAQQAVFEFTVPLDFCHSVDVVQGGFVTAMLDAAMSHALFGTEDNVSNVASLDITTQFISACRGNQPLSAIGRVKKATFRTAFLEAEIQDATGAVVATAQSVAKLSRHPS